MSSPLDITLKIKRNPRQLPEKFKHNKNGMIKVKKPDLELYAFWFVWTNIFYPGRHVKLFEEMCDIDRSRKLFWFTNVAH